MRALTKFNFHKLVAETIHKMIEQKKKFCMREYFFYIQEIYKGMTEAINFSNNLLQHEERMKREVVFGERKIQNQIILKFTNVSLKF